MSSLPKTITSDELAAITALTVRRLGQIADLGFIPVASEAKYPCAAALAGMFRYYREHNLRTKDSAKEEKLQKENRLLDLKIAREERKTIERAEANKLFLHVASVQKSVLFAALEREYPGKVVGRTAAEISMLGRDLADRLCAVFQRELDQWQKQD